MNIEEIIEHVEALGDVLAFRPQPGDGSPEISWGDVFFYYAPDGSSPTLSRSRRSSRRTTPTTARLAWTDPTPSA